jgi:hypothetical protein
MSRRKEERWQGWWWWRQVEVQEPPLTAGRAADDHRALLHRCMTVLMAESSLAGRVLIVLYKGKGCAGTCMLFV